MSSVERVLIVGGGVGGLTAAIGLTSAGKSVDVVELSKDWSVYGVGIIQPANCLRAFDEIGAGEAVLEAGYPITGRRFHDSDGNRIGDVELPVDGDGHFPPLNGITRPRLHHILQDGVRAAGAEVRLGVTVAELGDDGESVDVKFSDGTSGRYDLVVGADGVRSRVRELLFGSKYQPEFTGQVCWRYNLPRPPEIDRLCLYVGTGSKAGLVPIADDLMYLLLIEPPEGPLRIPEEELADRLRARLAGYGDPIATFRDELITDPTKVVYRPVDSVWVSDPWYRGRVMLLGDAAHATSPHLAQGAAMAVEDAVLLGRLVREDRALEEILGEWNSRRVPRVRFIVESCEQIARWELEEDPDADHVSVHNAAARLTAQPI